MLKKLESQITGTFNDLGRAVLTRCYEDEKWYIYSEKILPEEAVSYALFKKTVVPCTTYVDGKIRVIEGEFKESYPRSEAFGKWAWSYPTFDSAKAGIKYHEHLMAIRAKKGEK